MAGRNDIAGDLANDPANDATTDPANDLLALLLRLGDDHLILSHRLSEWCGHAPMLEEDLALPNMALDLIGTARMCYGYAGEIEGGGRSEDDYAFLRDGTDFRHMLMVERPNGDFAHTILRQFLFAAWMHPLWDGLTTSSDARLADHAGKAVKEMAYHVRHSGEWVIRLGDGTDESARRMRAALDDLTPYIGEMCAHDETAMRLVAAGLLPEPDTIRAAFEGTVARTFTMAQLPPLEVAPGITGGRTGRHGEVLGHLLAEMQFMQRAYPGLTW